MRITRLDIYCKNVVEQQKFYSEVLGLKINNASTNSFELHTGYSVLHFQKSKNFKPYHIAFHIPDKEEVRALDWLKNRVEILSFDNKEIVDFKGWDAKSIYFYDADNNIMEFISRRNYIGESVRSFSDESILGISEIGLATDDIQSKFQFLNNKCELSVFDGNFDKFCAIGDDEGLLITINCTLKTWFPTGDKAYNSAFKLQFITNDKEYSLEYTGENLRLLDPFSNV